MKSRWDESEAARHAGDPLALRVYSSRLLGADPDLVLHGGGNTSVKVTEKDFFGNELEVLYVKGSGWDLASIEKAGFAPVRLETLKRLATFEALSDTEIVKQQRLALLDPNAPDPSVEAILHAVIPRTFVDHTHADAAVTLTNTPDAARIVKEVYGERVLVVPYVMPGFTLARFVYGMTRQTDWDAVDGLLLMNHGLFTFADDARESYEKMIGLVTLAEEYREQRGATKQARARGNPTDPETLAALRKHVSQAAGRPLVGLFDDAPEAVTFANLEGLESLATRGPLTPDHVICTKRVPMVYSTQNDVQAQVQDYQQAYEGYFQHHAAAHHTMLDPAPRWVVLVQSGSVYFGSDEKSARVVGDIARHTMKAVRQAEALGGWQALSEVALFEMEYWELEQAKLKRQKAALPFTGRVALITGAAKGIGKACAEHFQVQGANVVALDLDASIEQRTKPGFLGLGCDVTNTNAVNQAVTQAVKTFGGIDILVSNAGIFPPSQTLDVLEDDVFGRSLEVNLNAHRKVLQACLPYLELGWQPSVILMASKNVPAPGPGAAAYSTAKAGLTQLGRVAALELAPKGIRVNMLHPDAVYDTAFWTEEILKKRAESYGLSVEAYKKKSLLGTEVTSNDVAKAALALAGDTFLKTTGAQVPVDGGNDRVI